MKYQGSCHCGRVAFDVEGTIDSLLACNCSMCGCKGSLLWFVPRDALKLRTPDGDAASYTFNRHIIKHRFCPVCGIHPYGEGKDQKGNPTAAINARCLEDVDLSTFKVIDYDGRAK